MISPACKRYLDQAQLFGIKLGLDNMRAMLSSLGQPEKNFPSIHVAGTNGKGSVSAMLERIFRLNGFKTGLYTSPHLVEVRERIRLNGRMIPEKTFCHLLLDIKKREKKLKRTGEVSGSLTFFEILTLCAFDYFNQEAVDLAVLEVGMGGRFDATNVVIPEVSVITSISYDHQQYLGKTISTIAAEKAGIIKRGVPCLAGVQNQTALGVIKKKCQEMGSPLIEVFGEGRKLTYKQIKDGYVFTYVTPVATYRFKPSLPGLHQGENAAIAIAAAEVMQNIGYQLSQDRILEALETVVWPGRLEIISRTPLVILDGGHNEDGARAISDYIKENVAQPVILVFAIMKDKEVKKVGSRLFPLASRIILTRPSLARAALPEDIARQLPEFSPKFFLEEDVASALRLALTLSEGKIPVIVAGSLYLVGEAKRFFSGSGVSQSLAYL